MINTTRMISALSIAAFLVGIAGIPANADSSTTQSMSSTTQSTTTTPVTAPAPIDQNPQALSLHDQAVIMAHRATWAAQHGEKQLAVSLASQAQSLFNQAFQSNSYYAHRTGQ